MKKVALFLSIAIVGAVAVTTVVLASGSSNDKSEKVTVCQEKPCPKDCTCEKCQKAKEACASATQDTKACCKKEASDDKKCCKSATTEEKKCCKAGESKDTKTENKSAEPEKK